MHYCTFKCRVGVNIFLVSDLANTGAGIQRKRTLAKSLRDSFRRLKSRRGSRKKKADGSAASPSSARSPERYINKKDTGTFCSLGLCSGVYCGNAGGFLEEKNGLCLLQSLHEIL